MSAPIPRLPPPWGPTSRIAERGTEPGACAACSLALDAVDAGETEGGQMVHANGCPVDEPGRRRS